jgi:3-hydroxy-3-methylglutaryl CoA synthase
MVGISACGAYIPRYRLSRKAISNAFSWLSTASLPGEKAIANFDEDSLTMAVAAAMNSLKEFDRARLDGVYFATTTAAYRERESAAIIATSLDLRQDIRTADFSDSLKSGTAALLSACDSVKAGGAANILLCGADCRLGKPGSAQEMTFGDGAAAFILSNKGVIAGLEGSYSITYDFPDFRRAEHDKFVRTMEDRFVREEGYTKFIPEAISGLMKKYSLEAKDFAKVAFPCLNARQQSTMCKNLGFQPNQIQQPLLGSIGETGTASPLILLIAMLEEAKPGDNILVTSYGSGAEALFFKVTDEITKVETKQWLKKYLDFRAELDSYEKYLVFRNLLPVDTGYNEETAKTELPLTWRERRMILAFVGSRCKHCGTPQYPPQRICVNPNCGATDEMEDYTFSNRKGKVFSFTKDYAAFGLNQPMIYGMIDFDDGGRFVLEITDCEADAIDIGMCVEMSLRRKYFDEPRGIYGYFWKAIPIVE